jgi:hypothetical protein
MTATNQVGRRLTPLIKGNEMTALFICAIEENTMILCENHAKVFEIAAMTAETPHTIIELEDTDTAYICHACNLRDELNKPRIILPN